MGWWAVPTLLWVNGQYEDRVYSDAETLKSTVVPGFGLTVAQIFG